VSGGMQGRPQKLQDVCYSWWALSALTLLGRLHWVDGPALERFVLHCQARAPPARAPTRAPTWPCAQLRALRS